MYLETNELLLIKFKRLVSAYMHRENLKFYEIKMSRCTVEYSKTQMKSDFSVRKEILILLDDQHLIFYATYN